MLFRSIALNQVWKFYSSLVGIIGSVLLALGIMSLFRYWAGLVVLSEGRWHDFIRPMAIHTATGFVILGSGIFTLAWCESRRKVEGVPHWLPVSIFVAVSTGTALLWQTLVEQEHVAAQQALRTELTISPLPTVILLGGCILAGLLAVATALAQRARQRTKLLNEGNQVLAREIAQHRQAEEALRKQTELLNAVFACMTEDVIVADAQGKILVMNQAAQRTLGINPADTPANAPMTDWSRLAHIYLPDQHTPFPSEHLPLVCALRGEVVNECEQFVLQQGAQVGVWRSVNGRPLRDPEGKVYGGVTVGHNITEHKQAEAALRESEERFRSLCVASPIGIFQNDATGACVYTNSRWQEITGLTLEESLGQGWTNAIFPEDREVVFTEWQACVAAEREFIKEFRFMRPTGEVRWVQVQAAPLRSDDGIVSGYVGVSIDITERKEVDRIKDEFVSVVSHELRTPLTSIRGSLGLLASGRLGILQEKGQRMLEIAVANTDRLIRLINDILDIERMQSGKIAMQKQECSAAELMTQATEVMRASAEKAEVTLSVSPHATRLWVDPDRILQTLTNLLSNAIKFSPRGATVWLTAEPQEGQLRFEVKDQGRGIPTDKLESIFERFQQVDASDSREKGGTGLGLAICRSIVQQHGGHLSVESTLGEGSTFSFTLPTLNSADLIALDFLPHVNQTILVCDDNPVIGEVLKAMLEYQGYQAAITTSGRDALQQAIRLQPAAILLDLLMPEMDGWQTAAALKELPETRDIPVIILSGLSSQEVKSFPTAISAWLCKPVEGTALFHALKRVVNGQSRTARVLVAEDDLDLAKVLILTLQRHGIESFYAQTGWEAIQLSQNLSPDLLILDLGMPDGDGFTVVNWLRQQNDLRQVPLIVYSAKDLDEGERERLKLGPTQFFTKGRVTPEEFEHRAIDFLHDIIAQKGEAQSNGTQAYFGH